MRQDRFRPFDGQTPDSINPLSASQEVGDTWLPVAGGAGGTVLRGRPVSPPPADLLRRIAEGDSPLAGHPAPSGVADALRRSSIDRTALRRDLSPGVASRASSAEGLEAEPGWQPVVGLTSRAEALRRRETASRPSGHSDPVPSVMRKSATATSRHPQDTDDRTPLVVGAHHRPSGDSSAISDAPGRSVLRRAGDPADPLGGQQVPGDVMEVLRRSNGHGQRLPADVESGMGRQFGTDLSPVRVHGDREADVLARSVQATAFTHGRDIYFSRGSFSPGSPSGRRLLAHELAHVTAEQGGASGGPVIGHANDPAERDADKAADRVMAGLTTGPGMDAPVTASVASGGAEPIARTIRRNRVKDMVNQAGKAVRPRRSKKAKPGQLGGASIADLKAASNDAHATNGRLGGAPLGQLRAATHAHDTPTHLGETRSKRSRKPSHAAPVSRPVPVRVRDRFGQTADASPESSGEEAKSTGGAGRATAVVQQQAEMKSSSSEGEVSGGDSSSESSSDGSELELQGDGFTPYAVADYEAQHMKVQGEGLDSIRRCRLSQGQHIGLIA